MPDLSSPKEKRKFKDPGALKPQTSPDLSLARADLKGREVHHLAPPTLLPAELDFSQKLRPSRAELLPAYV